VDADAQRLAPVPQLEQVVVELTVAEKYPTVLQVVTPVAVHAVAPALQATQADEDKKYPVLQVVAAVELVHAVAPAPQAAQVVELE